MTILFPVHRLLLFLCLLPLALADPVIYGPIVQWDKTPQTRAVLTWITRSTPSGTEGKWAAAQASIGYGDDDDETILPNMQGNYRRVVMRRSFTVPRHFPDDAELILEMHYDDAFIAYINGREVARVGVTGSGNGATDFIGHEARDWQRISLGKLSDFTTKDGANIIALDGYNQELNSSDFTLDARLIAETEKRAARLVRRRAVWEYLAGAAPEENWQSHLVGVNPPLDSTGATYTVHLQKDGGENVVKLGPNILRRFGETHHTVMTTELNDLEPDTIYHFGLYQDENAKPVRSGRFRTAPAEHPETLRFITGGDMFTHRDLLEKMNTRCGLENPMFAMLGGDLAYANGVSYGRWFTWFEEWRKRCVTPDGLMIPMVVAIGNHEVKGAAYHPVNTPPPSEAPYFYSLFQLPGGVSNYAIDITDELSLVLLDSGHTQPIAIQTEWLAETLAGLADRQWTYVCYHRPAYGAGVKENASEIQREWSPIFERHLVDGVFENDHHTYTRTHPIRAGEIDEEKGVVYMGDGSWGAKKRNFDVAQTLTDRPWLAAAAVENAIFRVDITGNTATYTGLASDGRVLDTASHPARRAKD